MKSNKNSSIYSIRVKLVSAVAMLLVATIMVVSSTYAWFTLSTAPEITGVSTAVGANGALEMLLATKNDQGWFYGTGSVGNKSDVERNSYWGNLVKLDDTSYGSQAITLYPSKLNLNDGKLNLLQPLQTPKFGSDGRVEALAAGGNFAKYDGTNFMQDDSYYGFRALGVASGLTKRQQAFRSAVSSVATAQYNAQTEARRSLSANGTPLANIAVSKALNSADAKVFTQADVDAIGSMVSGLEVSLKQVEEAYIQAIIAYALGNQRGHATDDAALSYAGAIKNAANIENATLDERLTAVFGLLGTDATAIQAAMLGYDKYTSAVASVVNAKAKHAAITEADKYSWNDISEALKPLVEVSEIKINGIPAGEVTDNKSQIISDVTSGKGIKVNIPTGGGVYADIADLAGDYTVDIEIDGNALSQGTGVTFDEGFSIQATMTADSNQPTPYLAQVSSAINNPNNQPTGDASGALPLTELYGYVIDLAFRTNAAQSNLLLQTEAKDRIYSENNNTQTMGSGSTMTFKSSSPDFTTQQVKNLMSNIRVVFYSTEDQSNMAEIYATAKLDVTPNGVVEDANGITAKLYIYKTSTAIVAEYDNDNDDATPTTRLYKVDGKYYDSTVCIPGKNEVTPAAGSVTDTAETATVEVRDNVITALNQGEIKHISALVYLDGEDIENDDVAATVAQSMTGSVNFQFASSATLVPMEYGNLHTPNSNENN